MSVPAASSPSSPACDAPEVWCCLPVYNNAATIVDIARRCRAQMALVVVVDDGSTDAHLPSLLATLDVTVLRHEVNQGKGAALRTGFAFIRSQGGRFAITLDGDGQHGPEDLPAMVAACRPGVLVLGRRHRVTGVMPGRSLFGRELSDGWVELETGHRVRDSQSGFRVYPLEAVAALPTSSRHYNFEVEIVTRALWAGLSVTDVPIGVWYPSAEARVSSFDPWRDNLRLAWLHTRLIGRQLLPWPHRRVACEAGPARGGRPAWWRRNAWPLGLALALGLALVLTLMHGPWGALATACIAWRLHLNPLAALAGVVVGAAMHHQPVLAMQVGDWFVDASARPGAAWFIGSHLVGPAMALAASAVTYRLARLWQPLRRTVESTS